MRIFKNFEEALKEIERDIHEMGIQVRTATYQDKPAFEDKFTTLEIQNYSYTVLSLKDKDFILKFFGLDQKYATQEFLDRVSPPSNPGKSWLLRKNVWQPFLEPDGKFSYTYSERMSKSLYSVLRQLKIDPNSRQLYIPIYDPTLDPTRMGTRRIPCSLGYHLLKRKEKLNMTYFMRSCDFYTHYGYDLWLAATLLEWIADQTEEFPGSLTHIISSLHIYKKDAKPGVF